MTPTEHNVGPDEAWTLAAKQLCSHDPTHKRNTAKGAYETAPMCLFSMQELFLSKAKQEHCSFGENKTFPSILIFPILFSQFQCKRHLYFKSIVYPLCAS